MPKIAVGIDVIKLKTVGTNIFVQNRQVKFARISDNVINFVPFFVCTRYCVTFWTKMSDLYMIQINSSH
jgi:hypothetical protein